MIVKDKTERVILWGYKYSDKEVLGQLAYISSYVFTEHVLLENGLTIEIPQEYLGKDYAQGLVNFRAKIVNNEQNLKE